MVINHINGVKSDNRISNLEIVTPSQNIRHAHRTGLANYCKRRPTCTLSDDDVLLLRELRKVKGGVMQNAHKFNASIGILYSVARGEAYRWVK
jgi:hypothetical protein